MATNFSMIETNEDPYSILGISKNVSQEEIIKAYRQKAKIYHPDKNVNSEGDLKELRSIQMKQLTSAYNLLINDRAKADELSEKSQENDSYSDGLRINSGYLTLDKRFSDKFRTPVFNKDDLSFSFEYTLDKDLKFWDD